MKKKEIKKIAEKMADKEIALSLCHDVRDRQIIEQEMFQLAGCAHSIEDMMAIDDAVQTILQKKIKK